MQHLHQHRQRTVSRGPAPGLNCPRGWPVPPPRRDWLHFECIQDAAVTCWVNSLGLHGSVRGKKAELRRLFRECSNGLPEGGDLIRAWCLEDWGRPRPAGRRAVARRCATASDKEAMTEGRLSGILFSDISRTERLPGSWKRKLRILTRAIIEECGCSSVGRESAFQ